MPQISKYVETLSDRLRGIHCAECDSTRPEDHALAVLLQIVDSTVDSILVTDENHVVVLMNSAAERMFGVGADAVIGGTVTRFIPEPFRQAHAQGLMPWNVAPPASHSLGVVSALRDDGQEFPVEITVSTSQFEKCRFHVVILRAMAERQRVTAQALETQAHFDDFVDAVGDYAVVHLGPHGVIRSWNEGAAKLTGISIADAVGLHIAQCYQDVTRDERAILGLLETARTQPRVRDFAWRIRKDGSRYWAESVITAVRDGNNAITGFMLVARDGTSSRVEQETLHERNNAFSVIWNSTPLPIVIGDREGRVLDWNKAAEDVVGWNKAEVLGRPNPSVPAAEWPAYRHALARVFAGESLRMQGLRVPKDGPARRFVYSMAPLHSADGDIRAYVSIALDMTDVHAAEEALRVSEHRNRILAESVNDVLFDIDVRKGTAAMSGAMTNQLGYEHRLHVDRAWWESRLHPDEKEATIARHLEAIGSSAPGWTDEYRFQRADGTYATLLERAQVQRDAQGRAVRIIGTWMDVSERKALELQLQQAQKMEAIGSLASGIAHDFNNILTAINGFARLLQVELPPGAGSEPLLREIQKASDRAASLTRQLLAFSRRQILRPKALDMNRAILDLDPLLRRIIGEDVVLRVELRAQAPVVHADPSQLEQVVMNLAVNARDAMENGGDLLLETMNVTISRPSEWPADVKPGKYVRLSVTDTGAGMTPDIQARIFEPFFTTKSPGRGTGLGLATVYGVVRQSNGHVSVHSAPGRGTTFTILLPEHDAQPEACAPQAVAAPVRGQGKVLLVEDDAGVRSLVQSVLEKHGYTVYVACDGPEALSIAEQQPGGFDLLLTDVVMPRLSGRHLAERLKQRFRDLRVLYMSGYTDDAVIRYGVSWEKTPLIQKPFAAEALLSLVANVLATPPI